MRRQREAYRRWTRAIRPVTTAGVGLFLLLGSGADASAQLSGGGSYAGAVGGGTWSNLSTQGVGTDRRWGFTAGLFGGYRTNGGDVMLEALWSRIGSAATRLDYIEIPFTLGGVLPLSRGGMGLRFYTGIDLAFKVGCKSDIEFEEGLSQCDLANSTVWTWPIGASFNVMGESGYFGIDIRYNNGLSSAFSQSALKNRYWMARLQIGVPHND